MAIQFEYVENGERIRHYSDLNFKIRQIETGVIYDDAVDVLPCRYTYEVTNEPIETDQSEENPDTQALNIILGEEE